jgi:hypothetical protein
MHAGRKYGYSLDTADRQTADALRGGVEKTLMLIGQGALCVPEGADVVEFVKHGGRPPDPKPAQAGQPQKDEPVKLSAFRERYLEARSGGSMEANSLATARMHLGHFERTLGDSFDLKKLTLADLQAHLGKRRKEGDPRVVAQGAPQGGAEARRAGRGGGDPRRGPRPPQADARRQQVGGAARLPRPAAQFHQLPGRRRRGPADHRRLPGPLLSEEQRRRYRHLVPDLKQKAMAGVFG